MAFEHYQRMTNEAQGRERNLQNLSMILVASVKGLAQGLEERAEDGANIDRVRRDLKENLGYIIRSWVRLCDVLGFPPHAVMADDLSAWQARDDHKTMAELGIDDG